MREKIGYPDYILNDTLLNADYEGVKLPWNVWLLSYFYLTLASLYIYSTHTAEAKQKPERTTLCTIESISTSIRRVGHVFLQTVVLGMREYLREQCVYVVIILSLQMNSDPHKFFENVLNNLNIVARKSLKDLRNPVDRTKSVETN